MEDKLTKEQIKEKLYAGELRDLAHLRGIRFSDPIVDPITLANATNEKVHEEKPTGKKVKVKK